MRFSSSKFLAIACLIAAFAFMALAGLLEVREIYVPVFVLLIAAVVFGYRAFSGSLPTVEDTERFLIDLLASKGFGGAFCVSGVSIRAVRGATAGKAIVRFSAEVAMTEPLYKATLLDAGQCAGFTPRRISALHAAALRLRDELGAQAGALAARPPDDPFERRYITAAAKQGLSVAFSGVAEGTLSGDRWRLRGEDLSGEFGTLVRTGLPRSAFPDALVLDSSDGRQWVGDTMEAWALFSEQVGELQRLAGRIAAERARAAVEAFFVNIRSGALFSGTGESATGQIAATPFFLEFTGVSAREKHVELLLRNDSGWQCARPFSGAVTGDPEMASALIQVSTEAGQASPDGGPLISADSAFDMQMRWRPDAPGLLAARSGDFNIALVELAPGDVVSARAAVFPNERMLLQLTSPGTRLSGRVSSDGFEAAVRLEFLPAAEGDLPHARLMCRDATGLFRVGGASSRYAAERYDLMLTPLGDFAPEAEGGAWQRLVCVAYAGGFEGRIETASGLLSVKLYQ